MECARLAAFGLVGAGVGHLVEYLLILRGRSGRHAVLAYTGDHDLVASAVATGAMLLLVATVLTGVPAIRRGMGRTSLKRAVSFRIALPVVQAVAFAVVEVGESVITHSSAPGLGLVLILGVPLQLLVGSLLAVLVRAISRSGERLGRIIAAARFRPPARVGRLRPVSFASPGWSMPVALEPTRGPPSTALSS